MTDLFDDDDLFAPRPAPAPAAELPPRRSRPAPKPAEAMPLALSGKSTPDPCVSAFVGPRWPTASLACVCGGRDEVAEPCPDRLDCWNCHGLETMRRIVPRYLPPKQAGRQLTAHEREGMKLDAATAPCS